MIEKLAICLRSLALILAFGITPLVWGMESDLSKEALEIKVNGKGAKADAFLYSEEDIFLQDTQKKSVMHRAVPVPLKYPDEKPEIQCVMTLHSLNFSTYNEQDYQHAFIDDFLQYNNIRKEDRQMSGSERICIIKGDVYLFMLLKLGEDSSICTLSKKLCLVNSSYRKDKWEIPSKKCSEKRESVFELSWRYIDFSLHTVPHSYKYFPEHSYICFSAADKVLHGKILESGLQSTIIRITASFSKKDSAFLFHVAYDTEVQRKRGRDLLLSLAIPAQIEKKVLPDIAHFSPLVPLKQKETCVIF